MLRRFARKVLPARITQWLHERRVAQLVQEYPTHVVEHRYHGFPLKVYLSDGLAAGWYDNDWEPMVELEFLQKHRLVPGARVFDCGAHQGVVAMMLAKIVGPDGSVIAVECMEHNCKAARRNAELNDLKQIQVIHAGVADVVGELRFGNDLNSTANTTGGSVIVPAVTIDQLAENHGPPDVLFIDVEGYELRALQGARQTLSRRPSCFVEVHVGHGLERAGGSAGQVIDLLASYELSLNVFRESERNIYSINDCPPDLLRDRFFLLAV